MVVGLLILGPEKVPGVARSLAKLYRELRTTGAEFSQILRDEVGDVRDGVDQILKSEFDSLDQDLRGVVNEAKNGAPQAPSPAVSRGVEASARSQQVTRDWSQTVEVDLGQEDES